MSNQSKTIQPEECQGYIFDPVKQHLVRTNHPQHKFNLTTRRCIRCNLHEFHLLAVPVCVAETILRHIEEDGIIIYGPES